MRILSSVSIVAIATLVNAPAFAGISKAHARMSSIEELTAYMLKQDNAVLDAKGDAALADLAEKEPKIEARGESTDDGELRDHRTGTFLVLLDDKGKPFALFLTNEKNDPKTRVTDSVAYRISLTGTLQKAEQSTGKFDEQGNGIPGSSHDTLLSPKDKKAMSGARAELNFWRERTAKKIAAEKAKKKAAKK